MNRMKISWLIISLIMVLLIAGCGAAPSKTPSMKVEPPTLAATPTTASYPAEATQSTGAYPATSGQTAATAYPAPQGTSSALAWADAEQLILKGEVTQIVQNQSLDLTLTLKSGGTVTSKAPAANSVQTAITTCGDLCKSVVVTNQ